MDWPYELQLACRNLRRHRWRTVAMIAGLALAVVVMIYIPCTMGSFYADIIDRSIEQNSAHVTVWPLERSGHHLRQLLDDLPPGVRLIDSTFPRRRDLTGHHALARQVAATPGVTAVAGFVEGNATIQRGKAHLGILVAGIEPDAYARVVNIAKHYEGHCVPRLGPDDVAIGFRMAEKLGVNVGGRVQITTPQTHRQMRVQAVFRSGYYDNDLSRAYVSLKTAQVMFSMGSHVSALAARCGDLNQAKAVAAHLNEGLAGRQKIRNWMDDNASLLTEIATVKRVTGFISVLVALVASVGMANVFGMFVLNRQKDLAILRAMGGSRLSLRAAMLLEGAFIWAIGTVAGCLAVLIVMAYEQAHPYQVSAETYGIGSYATRPDGAAFLAACALAAATMAGSAWWSTRRVARLNPAEVIFGR